MNPHDVTYDTKHMFMAQESQPMKYDIRYDIDSQAEASQLKRRNAKLQACMCSGKEQARQVMRIQPLQRLAGDEAAGEVRRTRAAPLYAAVHGTAHVLSSILYTSRPA